MTPNFFQRLNKIKTDEESAGESSDEYTDSAEEESDEDQEEQIPASAKGKERARDVGDSDPPMDTGQQEKGLHQK